MIMYQGSLFSAEITPIEIRSGDQMVINCSGGKDSILTLGQMVKRFPNVPKTVIYNNTGFEHQGVWEYIQSICTMYALSVIKLDSPGLFPMIRQRGKLPSQLCRFCTGSLKIDPSAKWMRQQFKSGRVINVFGFRAEESPERAKRPPIVRNEKLSTRQREVINYAPLHSWLTGNVFDALKAEGIEPFHTYQYLSRLSCRFCFLAGKRDQEAVKANDPEGFALVEELKDSLHSETVIPLRKAA